VRILAKNNLYVPELLILLLEKKLELKHNWQEIAWKQEVLAP
jgi:hypothetical protein